MYKAMLYRIGRHAFVCSLAVLGGTATVALAFTEPSGGPTGGTVYAPVNTGGIAQTKIGNFTSSGTITGATVNGTGSICLAGNCINSWPAGGSSTGSAGTVQFSNGSGGFNGDAANFFWDNTNGRLGIGTASPSEKLHIAGNIYVANNWYKAGDLTAVNGAIGAWSASGGIISGFTGGMAVGMGQNTLGCQGIGVSSGSTPHMSLARCSAEVTLGVYLNGPPQLRLFAEQSAGFAGSEITLYKSGSIDLRTQQTDRLFITSGGNVGIGTAGPSQKLDVAGNIKAGRLYLIDTTYSFPTGVAGVGTDGSGISIRGDVLSVGSRDGVSYAPVYASAYNIGSSIRFKTDVTASPYGLQDVLKLEPKRFRYIYDLSKLSIGLIAEEVAPVIPEVVAREDDGTPKAIDYGKLTVVLVGAVKELKTEVDALKTENQALKERIESLEGR